ncbi:hypothetical protein, partial [Klebsiella electrica]|uniref:hypothetical protein n=1 Tax=Klebsiella electrica TaxID=1259973 RepID=UPI003F76EB72
LQGVVARVRRKPPPGMFPGGAALTGATRCGRPGQAQAATRGGLAREGQINRAVMDALPNE